MLPPPVEEAEPPPPAPLAAIALGVTGLLFVTLGATAQALHLAWGLWFSELFVFLAVPVIALQLAGRHPTRALRLAAPAGRGLLAGFTVGLCNYAAWAVPLMWLAEQVFPREIVERFSSARLFERQTPLELVVVVLGVSLAAPLGEEVLYRGLVQAGLSTRVGWPRAVVVTGLLFSLMHFDPVGLLARFELGVVFGLLAWRAGSLWPAIGAHAANNLTSCAVFFALGADDADVPLGVAAALFVGGNAALAGVVAWLARSRAWRPPHPAAAAPAEPPPLGRALRPWLVAALGAVALLVAVDLRGVRLNLIDLTISLPAPAAGSTDEARRAWRELTALRARARRGEADLAEYRDLRQRLASAGQR
ncbi:MAG: CPBP family intramembrane metalloprotease [Myxococcaceae bacterium]|jgi:membrane protease YdiL (CAAX protease family)|nr:CPBP family intramembrane metalloprotease [Myxococcaceae bacterium]